MKKLALVLVSALALSADAQNPCVEIEAAKTKIYNFHPSLVDKQTREAKSKEMDAFWKEVKAAGPAGVICLRQLLLSERDGFFLFDGASLLFSLDESDTSLNVIKSALARVALADIDIGGYMSLLIRLGQKNMDIGPLAARYLMHPDVTALVRLSRPPTHPSCRRGYRRDRLLQQVGI